jgi:type IV pilus assembly protein PilB
MDSSGIENETGERLVRQQLITPGDLEEAHKREAVSGTPWYRQLVQMRKLSFGAVNDVLRYEFHAPSVRQSHVQLGTALLDAGVLTAEHLEAALASQRRSGKLLGTVLVEEGFVAPDEIGRVLAAQYGLDFAPIVEATSSRDALDLVPEHIAKQKEFIPLRLEGDRLTVLISGPQSPARLKTVGVLLGVRIHAIMTAVNDLATEIESRYSGRPTRRMAHEPSLRGPHRIVKDVHETPAAPSPPPATKPKAETMEHSMVTEPKRFEDIARDAQGVPVVKLVTTIIEGAVNSGATDVHLDPQEPEMRVRYRIDGVLHDIMSIPREIESAVVSRIKILADIDITETRHPQDGHIGLEVGKKEFDVRVATLPTFLGERVVLRLLDQSSVLAGIKDLGLEPDDEEKLFRIIDQPYGMVLVTGPTGSGKTTTLYSCLNQMDVMTESIVTLEDPVEYQLSGINQVQIDTDIDRTFANTLRAALRQDIDVLLVGEIRDPETARIAIRAAMTGHLVLSTLHTNDAPEAISTLRNMDIPAYLVASALTAIVAQRLVRCICNECKTSYSPPKSLLSSLHLPESTKKLYKGKGCAACYHTGHRGRTGIFEILEINEAIRKMIVDEESVAHIAKAAKLKTMADRCRLKVKSGEITAEEFLRVIRT